MTWEVLRGDCRRHMAAMPDASVDAVVCDPPYELGFMGKAWDSSGIAYNVEVWEQALRVLRPGGHLCAFGGTRTYHRLTVAIEDAGFEIRDCLSWLYGQGFPKSRDMSKEIDRLAGVEREVIGERNATGNARKAVNGSMGAATARDAAPAERAATTVQLTAPATEDAERWQGWGTALKPSWEPIVLARKPFSGPIAINVLKHGTGAINVDGGRVAMSDADRKAIEHMTGYGKVGWEQPEPGVAMEGKVDGSLANVDAVAHEGGRWPPNATLSHCEDCRCVGEREVSTGSAGPRSRGFSFFGRSTGDEGTWTSSYGEEGKETIEMWDCVEGCPIRMLDEQSGERMPGDGAIGGASRFFYTSKAGRAERNAGVDAVARAGKRTHSGGADTRGRPTPLNRNVHPTVKPIDLMRWLVRLITPPDGVVLDPFCGSGSTGCAAVLEGFDFIGMDLDEEDGDYVATAKARIAFWAEHPTGMPIERALASERLHRGHSEAGQGSLFGGADTPPEQRGTLTDDSDRTVTMTTTGSED